MKNEETKKSRNKIVAHTQISIRLPNELLERIETFARADQRSRSNAIEHLLWQTVKEER
jgi:metal-responsive CopG/Arc/MetJ family transcriptional regulator